MAADLDRQIAAEETRTGVKDPAHFSYSTFAKSASQRRDNLRASADGLKAKLEAAQKSGTTRWSRLHVQMLLAPTPSCVDAGAATDPQPSLCAEPKHPALGRAGTRLVFPRSPCNQTS